MVRFLTCLCLLVAIALGGLLILERLGSITVTYKQAEVTNGRP